MSSNRYLDQPYLLAGRRIDPITGTLSYREVQKHLRRKELEVLSLLAEHSHADCVPRSVFIQQLWPTNPIGGEQGLSDAISALRRALQDDRENPLILTIPRRGYQLRASVRVISRDGGVAFVAGTVIDGRPDWRLKQLLERTDAHESWLAEDGRSRRIFRFCRNELQLRKLRREIVLMRYLREALARCEYVSTILDWQLEEPPYFLELAAPACGNLRGVMLGKSVPEPHERWQLLHQVTEALTAVHAAGVLHRNLGPDSVLVDRRGNERVALLGEFGLAALDDRQRLAELGIDPEGMSLKTALPGPATAYTAPECAAGAPASAASDVYALGVLIVQTLRGDFKRLASGFEEFPAEIAPLLQRCCAADPAARPSASEAAAKLREWTQPQPVPRSAELMPEPEVPVSPIPAISRSTETQAPNNVPLPLSVTAPGGGAPPLTPADQYIDRYRIVSEIAQGGMGVVYLAEQSEPVQRRVALKLIRAGLDSAQVLARFEAERQALAMMNHPNISAIFDAGTTPGGYPYFVMEYVPGKDIVRHCDDARLDLRARIRLFLQVCDGVLHAHQKGLIHRDLKPGNILVKHKIGEVPLVKLIDFGVAKSLAHQSGTGLHTRVGGFIGTPMYSCPEQVTDPTRDIDTRADLYSLGVVLYELLTGVPPRMAAELDTETAAELARRLRDTRNPSMGSRYKGLKTEEQHRIAELRASTAEVLSIQLGSDIDWIVSKCTAPDPDDRYATVQELRQDLQRWLDDRPVEARPANTWYRFRKLVQRNQLNTFIALTSILLLITTSALAMIGYHRSELARAEADLAATFQTERIQNLDLPGMGLDMRKELLREWERAPLDSALKTRLNEALDHVNFVNIAQLQLKQRHLQPSLAVIERDYVKHPKLQAELLLALAASARTLSTLDVAEQAIQRVLAIAVKEPLNDPILVLRAQHEHALVMMALNREPEAQMLLETTLAHLIEQQGADGVFTLKAMETLLELLLKRDDPAALPLAEQWIKQSAQNVPQSGALAIKLRQQLLWGDALMVAGKHQEGQSVLQEALRSATLSTDDDSIRLLRSQIELALADHLFQSDQRDEALDLVVRALQAHREVLGDRHERTLHIAMWHSEMLRHQGKLEEASALIDHAARLARETYGMQHMINLEAQYRRGMLFWMQGQNDAALQIFRALRARFKNSGGGSDYINFWSASHLIPTILLDMGQLDEAQGLIEELIATNPSPIQKWAAIHVRQQQARLLLLRGQPAAAVRTLRETLDSVRQQHPENLVVISSLQSQLGESLHINGQLDDSDKLLSEALRDEESSEYMRRVRAPLTLARLAALRFTQRRFQEALDFSEQAIARSKQFMSTSDPRWEKLIVQHERIRAANEQMASQRS
jgi:serine/threonine protein kinase/DNA-binding winged helix-turn-helix (wHTH) protein/tetratricopeptide (TPR) repeat protein